MSRGVLHALLRHAVRQHASILDQMLGVLACWARTAAQLLQGSDLGVSCSELRVCSQLAPWPSSLTGCWEKPGAPLLQAAGGGDVGQRRPPSTSRSTSRSRTAGKPPVSPVASPRGSSAFAQPGFHQGDDEEVMQEVAAALAAAKAVDKGKKPMTVAEVGWRAGFGGHLQGNLGAAAMASDDAGSAEQPSLSNTVMLGR